MLNGVSVVPNDNAAAYIKAVVFENCTLHHSKCLHQQSPETQKTHYIKQQHELNDSNEEEYVVRSSAEISKGPRGAVLVFSFCPQSTSVR